MTQDEWALVRHFKPEEFDSPDEPGSGQHMRAEFVRALDALRDQIHFPLYVSSGMRTQKHNAEVGGVDSSAHEAGWAADLAVVGRIGGVVSERRMQLVMAALANGFRRIGIGETFVHLDMDPTKPTPRMWTYPKGG